MRWPWPPETRWSPGPAWYWKLTTKLSSDQHTQRGMCVPIHINTNNYVFKFLRWYSTIYNMEHLFVYSRGVQAPAWAHTERPEEHSWESVLFFHLWSGHRTQVVRASSKAFTHWAILTSTPVSLFCKDSISNRYAAYNWYLRSLKSSGEIWKKQNHQWVISNENDEDVLQSLFLSI